MTYKYDWGSVIVDIVKKKDLDTDEFADCWEEEYDWTDLDLYVIGSYTTEVIEWGMTRWKIDFKTAQSDLQKYTKKLEDEEKMKKFNIEVPIYYAIGVKGEILIDTESIEDEFKKRLENISKLMKEKELDVFAEPGEQAYQLVWNDGDDNDGVFITNCPPKVLGQIVDDVKKVEDYSTDDVYAEIKKRGYTFKDIYVEEVDF